MDELLRRMTPAQKFRRVLELIELSRSLALTRLRLERPGESEATLRREIAIDLLPPQLARIMRDRDARREPG